SSTAQRRKLNITVLMATCHQPQVTPATIRKTASPYWLDIQTLLHFLGKAPTSFSTRASSVTLTMRRSRGTSRSDSDSQSWSFPRPSRQQLPSELPLYPRLIH